MAALQRFLNDPPVEGGHPGPFPSESGCAACGGAAGARGCGVAVADAGHARPRPFASGLPGENEEDEYLFLVSLDAFHEKNSGHRLNGTGCARPRRSSASRTPRAHAARAQSRSPRPSARS